MAFVPASLGDFGTNMGFSASENSFKMSLCFIGQKESKAPGGDLNFGANFYESGTSDIGTNLMENVWQYASAEKAIKAFETLSTNIKNCKGSSTQSWDNGDGTTTVKYQLAVDVSIPMIGLIKRKAEKVIVDTALKGLKKRVESSPADPS
mgnify:CR=1 FL=1